MKRQTIAKTGGPLALGIIAFLLPAVCFATTTPIRRTRRRPLTRAAVVKSTTAGKPPAAAGLTVAKPAPAKLTEARRPPAVAAKPEPFPAAAAAKSSLALETAPAAARASLAGAFVNNGPFTYPTYADSTEGDNVDGEDLVVRRAAVEALGEYNGSVVAVDPGTGRILTMVNQKLALSGGFQPCSTIKLSVALAGLSEDALKPRNEIQPAGFGPDRPDLRPGALQQLLFRDPRRSARV